MEKIDSWVSVVNDVNLYKNNIRSKSNAIDDTLLIFTQSLENLQKGLNLLVFFFFLLLLKFVH